MVYIYYKTSKYFIVDKVLGNESHIKALCGKLTSLLDELTSSHELLICLMVLN